MPAPKGSHNAKGNPGGGRKTRTKHKTKGTRKDV